MAGLGGPSTHKAGEDATEEVANAAGRRMARRGRGRGEQRKQPNGATEEDPEQKARGRGYLATAPTTWFHLQGTRQGQVRVTEMVAVGSSTTLDLTCLRELFQGGNSRCINGSDVLKNLAGYSP